MTLPWCNASCWSTDIRVFALRVVLTPVSQQESEPWPPTKEVSPS